MAVATERISPPPLFRRHTPRPRLTRLLDASKSQIILITAPAGYGKTTLAAEWLQGREDVVWYRATTASADLAAFSSGIADVVAPLMAGAGERLRQRLRVADAPERAARPLAELLAQDLADWPTNAWVVVDDYHLVTDSAPVEEFVDWLLMLAPVRFLVTSRRRPMWASARRILYGEITEIGRDQLAMNNEEAGRVLEGRTGEAVRALVAQAEGWPALIGLAALSASSELPEQQVSEALFRYFAEEVFRREPPEVQRFMLLASIPAAVSPRIARETLGIPEPEPLIEHLRATGLLFSTGSNELALHPLVRDFLSSKIRDEDPVAFESHANRAIDDARALERWDDAFQTAWRAGRFDLAARIVGEAASQLLDEGRLETVEKWLSAAHSSWFSEPAVALAKVEVLMRRGRLAEGASLAEEIARQLPNDHPVLPRALLLAGRVFHLKSEDSKARAYYQTATKLAHGSKEIGEALWGCFIAAAELEDKDASEYLDQLDKAGSVDLDARLRLATGRVLAAHRSGTYAGMRASVEPLLPLSDYAIDPMVRSSFMARVGDLQLACADYGAGRHTLNEAFAFCSNLHLTFAAALCLAGRTVAEIGLRRFADARKTLAEFDAIRAHCEDPFLDVVRRILGLTRALSARVPDREAATYGELAAVELPRPGQGEYWALLSVYKAASGELDEAMAYARRAREISGALEAAFYPRYAELICRMKRGMNPPEARREVVNLVWESHRSEFIHAFVVAYRAHPPLLAATSGDEKAASIARSTVRRANDQTLASQVGLAQWPESGQPSVKLTDREVEVLRLLAQGLSNDEIAKNLVISLSTAKVHVHHILRKLGVRNRLQAMLAAEEIIGEPGATLH
jgi:LuxR family transcriptional regulator, maltose regulon positive regulatory protein